MTSRDANETLMSIINIIFIISLWIQPELIDWKSIVLINTREIRSSSIDGYI